MTLSEWSLDHGEAKNTSHLARRLLLPTGATSLCKVLLGHGGQAVE
jgi:hypothetical protein